MDTYWLGKRNGNEIEFTTRVPADLAAIILHKDPPVKTPEDSKRPKYNQFTRTSNGATFTCYSNELAWHKTLDNGAFTYVAQGGGAGADWPPHVDTSHADWSACKAVLLADAHDYSPDWYSIKAIIVAADSAPALKLNRDLTVGTATPLQQAFWQLRDWQTKTTLTAAELETVRAHVLTIANAGRANTNYRREAGCKKDLDLKAGLPPLIYESKANAAAQNQADYCATTETLTHEQPLNPPRQADSHAEFGSRIKAFGITAPGAEAAGAGGLAEYPTIWMRSETHYAGFWNIGGTIKTIGFGVARGKNGTWYGVMVFVP